MMDAHGREAFDTMRARNFRQRILDLVEQTGDHDTVPRLSSPGTAGHGTNNDLKDASDSLGGSKQTLDLTQPTLPPVTAGDAKAVAGIAIV